MSAVRAFLVLMFLSAAILPLVVLPAQAAQLSTPPYPLPPWQVNCSDDIAWNGYSLDWADFCVPGILSQQTLEARFPRQYYGALSSYAPGVMEAIERRHGVHRGVALMSCGYMGYTVWLRVPGVHATWQGPFTVVDCSNPAHSFYHIAIAGLAAEVSYTTAFEWGFLAARRVNVSVGQRPQSWHGVNLSSWWIANALQWESGWGLVRP